MHTLRQVEDHPEQEKLWGQGFRTPWGRWQEELLGGTLEGSGAGDFFLRLLGTYPSILPTTSASTDPASGLE